jgi:hypothetical protein
MVDGKVFIAKFSTILLTAFKKLETVGKHFIFELPNK